MDETRKARNRGQTRKRSIRFCPKCGSTDIFFASGLPHLMPLWECRHCGYRGALIIKDGELSKILQKEYMKKSLRS